MLPDWLEPTLDLRGTLTDNYVQLYEVFCGALLDLSGVIVDDKPVHVDTNKDKYAPDYECSFIHFISSETRKGSGVRVIDFSRASKLHWIRPILEHYKDTAVRSFWHVRHDGEALYLWLHEHDFLIVLKKDRKIDGNIIVTAHNVENYTRKKLSKQYEASERKLS
ncbi:hypothetical protein FACS1894132_02120 [Clostridia bacterium]|nr:hypothetical protein FACS1894132_02120 [Clostridia bacterium]